MNIKDDARGSEPILFSEFEAALKPGFHYPS